MQASLRVWMTGLLPDQNGRFGWLNVPKNEVAEPAEDTM
jgi:hypothetical protein